MTDKYKKAIKPYKKWSELADMSPLIEVDGKYYRILRTTGFVDKKSTRKMVMCDQDGQLVEDEGVSRKCFILFFYLIYFEDEKTLTSPTKKDVPLIINRFITELKTIMENIESLLTEKEREAMEQQLSFYEQTKHYLEIVAKDAWQLTSYLEPIKKHQIDEFPASLVQKISDHIFRGQQNRGYVRALVIENHFKTEEIVRNILKNRDYQSYIPNHKIKKEILQDLKQLRIAANGFIRRAKIGWEREKKYLDSNKGTFSTERCTDELWKTNVVDINIMVHTNEFIDDRWLFSPTRIYR